ncbi:MAG: peptidoglycan bridge formation glycyltransferase FemA/FemB family protein [bacterium]|nr:peptidoglycan bridge formation glycyltransferase FemA/FemB family protein [bacterium]
MNDFLQSEEWMKFQEATGREVVRLSQDGFSANGIMHTLPLVGKYLYTPRWPSSRISNYSFESEPEGSSLKVDDQFLISKLIEKAEEKKVNWVRIEPQTEEVLEMIRKEIVTLRLTQSGNLAMTKAPHDVQPRETFVMDITPSLETLLAQMKPKTRYNIGLAEKRGVKVFATREEKYQEAFLDLITTTADRKEIVPHPRAYYQKFFTDLPEDMCQLFVAEYEGRILAANLLIIYGTRVTYLHGGSGNEHRDVMAPYLLQWEQMKLAKERGCTEYDFGGVRAEPNTKYQILNTKSWGGITRFKMGFSPQTQPTVFPGAYDIILNHSKYALYNRLRMFKENFLLMKKFLRM